MYSDPSLSLTDIVRGMWHRPADARLRPHACLFFELHAQALQG
jgi:hypothetical protein